MNYNNNLIYQAQFPKSNNHLITWRKNDKIKTCDLNEKCMEIIFDIKKNKNYKIINDIPPIIDRLPTGNSLTYETFYTNKINTNKINTNNLFNHTLINNIIPIILLVILLFILLHKKLFFKPN